MHWARDEDDPVVKHISAAEGDLVAIGQRSQPAGWLRERRLEAGFRTDADLARAVGVTPQLARSWGRGDSEPKWCHVGQLASALNVPLRDVIVDAWGLQVADMVQVIEAEAGGVEPAPDFDRWLPVAVLVDSRSARAIDVASGCHLGMVGELLRNTHRYPRPDHLEAIARELKAPSNWIDDWDQRAREWWGSTSYFSEYHRKSKKRLGVAGHKMQQERRARNARRHMPLDKLAAMGADALRGKKATPRFQVYRTLSRYARTLKKSPLEFFLCALCGKLASRLPSDRRRVFGVGCGTQVKRTSEWARWVNRRRDVDPFCKPPWATRIGNQRSSHTLKADLQIFLAHYVLGLSVRALQGKFAMGERGIQHTVRRCKEGLPKTWGHVFTYARSEPLRSARISIDAPETLVLPPKHRRYT